MNILKAEQFVSAMAYSYIAKWGRTGTFRILSYKKNVFNCFTCETKGWICLTLMYTCKNMSGEIKVWVLLFLMCTCKNVNENLKASRGVSQVLWFWLVLLIKGSSNCCIAFPFQSRNFNVFREIGLMIQWIVHFLLYLEMNM